MLEDASLAAGPCFLVHLRFDFFTRETWMEGCTDGGTNGWTDTLTEGRTNSGTNNRTYKRMNGRMDGRTVGQRNRMLEPFRKEELRVG